MSKENVKRSKLGEDDFLDELILDPCQPLSRLARNTGMGKTSAWRKKKALEDDHVIMGYTPVVDETKLGWQLYVMLIKGKVQSEEVTEKVIEHVEQNIGKHAGIRSINTYFTVGAYDFMLVFAARSNVEVKMYVDLIRSRYAKFLEDRPVVMNIAFTLRREGITNPEMKRMNDLMI